MPDHENNPETRSDEDLIATFQNAVFEAAISGDLTATWRSEHPDTEPASHFLERLQQQRLEQWREIEWARQQAQGHEPDEERLDRRYRAPEQPEDAPRPDLPRGWCWTTVDRLTCFSSPGRARSEWREDQLLERPLVLTSGNIDSTGLRTDPRGPRTLRDVPDADPACLRTSKGDLLFVQEAFTFSPLLARTALVADWAADAGVGRGLSLLRCTSPFPPEFLYAFLDAPSTRVRMTRRQGPRTMTRISSRVLCTLPVPLPPFDELLELKRLLRTLLMIPRRLQTEYLDRLESLSRLEPAAMVRELAEPSPSPTEPARHIESDE